MPQRTSRRAKLVSKSLQVFAALPIPEVAAQLLKTKHDERLARARAVANEHPTRTLANAFINAAWRNAEIEDIHAGTHQCLPLDLRRITPAEERRLMKVTCERLALAMDSVLGFLFEESGRSWPEQVLPYAMAEWYLITPSGWTLTETSRDVRLYP